MWVLLGGTFYTGGFVVGGPFKTEAEAEGSIDAMARTYDLGTCPEFWCFELKKPADFVYKDGSSLSQVQGVDPDKFMGYDPNGTAIVFDGDLTAKHWNLFGPFRDIEAARKWVSVTGGCAIELKPVPVTEPA
jgi:hypothetical protein